MTGRLRLDKLQQYIESYLKDSRLRKQPPLPPPKVRLGGGGGAASSLFSSAPALSGINSSESVSTGPYSSAGYGALYFRSPRMVPGLSIERLQEEMQTAVPLSEMVASASSNISGRVRSNSAAGQFFRRISAPTEGTSSRMLHRESAALPVPDTQQISLESHDLDESLPPFDQSSSGQASGEDGRVNPPPPSAHPVPPSGGIFSRHSTPCWHPIAV